MHWLYPFFYLEAKFGRLEKKIKCCWYETGLCFYEQQQGTHFLTEKERITFGRVEIIVFWRETKKIQIKLATTRNNNEQQNYVKRNGKYRPNGRRRFV